MERTLTIIKPDAMAAVTSRPDPGPQLEDEGFTHRWRLRRMQPEHRAGTRPSTKCTGNARFYDSLVEFMTSGPVLAAALERDDAVVTLRRVMGATNPEEADAGTIRADFAGSIERNAIHGSDSPENARLELAFFFSRADLIAA